MDTISILATLDENYLPQLQVLLTSLYWNHPGDRIDLYLLQSGISGVVPAYSEFSCFQRRIGRACPATAPYRPNHWRSSPQRPRRRDKAV